MSEFDSFDAAAEALAAANRGEASPEASPQASEQVSQPVAPEVDSHTAPEQFANIDPNTLPPELQAQYRNMQGEFTRRMQEIAAERKRFESIGDPDQAAQAMQLMQALQEDPVYVHQQLSQYLEANGLTPAEAQAVANEAVAQATAPDPFGEDDEFSALRKEIDELRGWREQQEAQAREQAFMAGLQREEMAIRQSNPSYKDEDLNAIYELAFAHGGSLVRAEQAYKTLRDRFAAEYIESKSSVPAGVSSPGAGGVGQPTTSFEGLNDPELDKAVQAALANALL